MTQNNLIFGDESLRKIPRIGYSGWQRLQNSPRSKTTGIKSTVKLNENGTRSRDAPGNYQPLHFGKRVERIGRSRDNSPTLLGLRHDMIILDEAGTTLPKPLRYQSAHLSKDLETWVVIGNPRRARFTMRKPRALFGTNRITITTASGAGHMEMSSIFTGNKIIAGLKRRFANLLKWFKLFIK